MSEQVRCTPTSSIGELLSSYVHPLHGNPYSSHHIYHLASLAYDCPHCCEPFSSFLSSSSTILLSLPSYVSTLVLTLIHCMSAQNIEKEWIKLTCTWLVVWGRVKIRFQKKTKCETLVD